MKTTIQFSSPKIIRAKLKNNKLHLKLDWGHRKGTTIISRYYNGYNYEDVEYDIYQFFKSGEYLIYEYNLPISIEILELLPIINKANQNFQISVRMTEEVNDLMPNLKAS